MQKQRLVQCSRPGATVTVPLQIRPLLERVDAVFNLLFAFGY